MSSIFDDIQPDTPQGLFDDIKADSPSTTEQLVGGTAATLNAISFMPRAMLGTIGGAIESAVSGDLNQFPVGFERQMSLYAVPENKYGQSVTNVLSYPSKLAHEGGDITFEKTGSPLAATTAEVGGNLAAILALGKVGKEIGKRIDPKIKSTELLREERGYTSLFDDIKPDPIPKQLDLPFGEPITPEITMPKGTVKSTAINSALEKAKVNLTPEEILAPIDLEKPNNTYISNLISEGKDVDTIFGKVLNATPEDVIQGARRGTISVEQAHAMANATGLSPEYFLSQKVGTIYNQEQILRFGKLNNKLSMELEQAALKAVETGAPEDLAAFNKTKDIFSGMNLKFTGAKAELGRGLSILREANKATAKADIVQKYLDQAGGSASIHDLARVIADASKKGTLKEVLPELQKSKFSDVVLEAYKSGLLTGIKTFFRNFAGNIVANIITVPERVASATVGFIRDPFNKKTDKVNIREVAAMLKGYENTPIGLKKGLEALQNEDLLFDANKYDVHKKAITAEGFGVNPSSRTGKTIDNTGKVIRTPYRLLNATDTVFKSVAAHQQQLALATRKAMAENPKLRGEELENKIAENMTDPKILEASIDWGHYLTFTSELGSIGRKVQNVLTSHPALHFFFPFIKTNINLSKFAIERIPGFNLLLEESRIALKSGGAERDMALGKLIVGGSIIASVISLVEDKKLSGPSSVEYKEASLEKDAGFLPYSFLIGDKYYPLNRMEPIGTLLVAGAHLHELSSYYKEKGLEAPEDQQKMFLLLSDAIGNVFTNNLFMGQVANLVDVGKSENKFETFLKNSMGSVVPTLVSDVRQSIDPYSKDPSVLEAIQARVPYRSLGVPNKVDISGQPKERKPFSMWNPWEPSEFTKDKAIQERFKWKIVDTYAPKAIDGVSLTKEQKREWEVISGQTSKKLVDSIVSTPEYDSYPPFVKKEVLSKTIAGASQLATVSIRLEILAEKEKYKKAFVEKLNPQEKTR